MRVLILLVVVVVVTGGKQSQLLLRPTKVGSGLQVSDGIPDKMRALY